MKIGCLYQGKFKLAEGPVWCDRTRSVWWVDMVDMPAVYRLSWGADQPQVFFAPLVVTTINRHPILPFGKFESETRTFGNPDI